MTKFRNISKRLNQNPDTMCYSSGNIQFYKNSKLNKWLWKTPMFQTFIVVTRKQIKENL